jgi:hypothetical protein
MSTGSPFIPAPFASTVVAPSTATGFRSTPYISLSEYRFAPTSVGTKSLVAGSTNQAVDSPASLAQMIQRASSWADLFCFHRADGTLAASQTVESDWVTAKPDGSLVLICNFKPVLEVTGMGMGPIPSQISNITGTAAANIWIQNKTILVPSTVYNQIPTTTFPTPVGAWNKMFTVWSYINGFPHTSLAADASKGATSITVAATNGSLVAGVYANTQLTIRDGANTETVTVASTPTANVLTLTSGLQYAHKVPEAPDYVPVSALPKAIEQAVISLTSCLIKVRGARAQVMSETPGGVPTKHALAQAGALEDYEIAADLLDPFVTVYIH